LEDAWPTSPFAVTIARLRCFRGIDTLSACGLAAEIGDFQRFERPKRLSGFLGIVPSEHSSGERRRQGSITKAARFTPAAYHVLDRGVPYHELGEEFFYRRDTEHTERYQRRLIRQLERLGHQVTLTPLPEAA
jgi:hypothetical protein